MFHLFLFKNPAALEGARGLVGLRRCDPFPIGVVNREGILAFCFGDLLSDRLNFLF
jgi:hypothetical protein